MRRSIASVVVGLIAWFLVATVVNLLLRLSWPGYPKRRSPLPSRSP